MTPPKLSFIGILKAWPTIHSPSKNTAAPEKISAFLSFSLSNMARCLFRLPSFRGT
jgi:hypothetical protein